MKRRKFILWLAGTAAIGCSGWKTRSSGKMAKVTRSSEALGARVALTVFHGSAELAEEAIDRAFAEIGIVERLMSLYRPDSQLSRLNRDGRLESPHPYLLEVLQAAKRLSERTDGAFDATIQPLWNLYSEKAREGRQPNALEIARARKKVDWRRMALSAERVELRGEGAGVTLNGIAQGFAADAAKKALERSGVASALIDTGEIGALGGHAGEDAWSVGIRHPRRANGFLGLAELRGRCLATSGDYESRSGNDFGQRRPIDPHAGSSPAELSSVSVAAPTAMQADGLSTAVLVLGLEKGMKLMDSTPETDALFVTKAGRIVRTEGFPHLT